MLLPRRGREQRPSREQFDLALFRREVDGDGRMRVQRGAGAIGQGDAAHLGATGVIRVSMHVLRQVPGGPRGRQQGERGGCALACAAGRGDPAPVDLAHAAPQARQSFVRIGMADVGVIPRVEFRLSLRIQRLAAAANHPARGGFSGGLRPPVGRRGVQAVNAWSQASRMRIMCFSTALTEMAKRSAIAR
ncbi:hypothetical protein D3C85_1312010 [compost metagenome]